MKEGRRRLTDSRWGALAAVLLAAGWVLSLVSGGQMAYASFPTAAWTAAALTVVSAAFFAGCRTVRLGGWPWFCVVGVGGYFLVRAATGYIEYANYAEVPVIVGGIAFYVAGIYSAHSSGGGALPVHLLAGALLLQMAAMLAAAWGAPPVWLANSPVRLDGYRVTCAVGLLTYKNFAAFFLAAGGMAAILHAAVRGERRFVFSALVGLAALGVSFVCKSRSAWLLAPLGVLLGWGAWMASRSVLGKPIGWAGIAGALTLLLALAAVALVGLRDGMEAVFSGDFSSHSRLDLANYAAMVPREGLESLIGTGARTFLWEVLPYAGWLGHMPNYAHNEYVQGWMDYGYIGLASMFIVLVGHVLAAGRRLSLLDTPARLGGLTAASLIAILVSLHACGEFIWHQPAFVQMTAFALGLMASPARKPIRAEGKTGRCALALLALALAALAGYSAFKLAPGWLGQWRYASAVERGLPLRERLDVLARVAAEYPDPDVVGTYGRLMSQTPPSPAECERVQELFARAADANPRHVINAYSQAAYLDALARYSQAEEVLRRMSIPGGVRAQGNLYSWHSLYALHLADWGRSLMDAPARRGEALSLLDYAYCLLKNRGFESEREKSAEGNRVYFSRSEQKAYLRRLENEIRLLRLLKVEPDHAWKSSASGRGPLYPEDGARPRRK